jgi:hypothetical protein
MLTKEVTARLCLRFSFSCLLRSPELKHLHTQSYSSSFCLLDRCDYCAHFSYLASATLIHANVFALVAATISPS